MKEFDKQNIKSLRPEIEGALTELGKKHGIRFTLGSGSFGSTHLSLKLECQLTESDADLAKEKEAKFRQLALLFGLRPDDYGKSFRQGRYTFTNIGLDPARPKNALQVKRGDGREFIMAPRDALFGLGRTEEALAMGSRHDLDAEARRENAWEAKVS